MHRCSEERSNASKLELSYKREYDERRKLFNLVNESPKLGVARTRERERERSIQTKKHMHCVFRCPPNLSFHLCSSFILPCMPLRSVQASSHLLCSAPCLPQHNRRCKNCGATFACFAGPALRRRGNWNEAPTRTAPCASTFLTAE